jgi:hypothetical protein
MKSIAQIHTQQATRLAKRLANHWKHKFSIEETEQVFLIHFPHAEILLAPEADQLTVTIQTTDDSANLAQLESVVLDHLIRMGQEPLTAEWQSSNTGN